MFPTVVNGRSLGAYVQQFNTRLKWSFRKNRVGFRARAIGIGGRLYIRQIKWSAATSREQAVERFWECVDGVTLELANDLQPRRVFRTISERRELDRLMGRASTKVRIVASGDSLEDLGN